MWVNTLQCSIVSGEWPAPQISVLLVVASPITGLVFPLEVFLVVAFDPWLRNMSEFVANVPCTPTKAVTGSLLPLDRKD